VRDAAAEKARRLRPRVICRLFSTAHWAEAEALLRLEAARCKHRFESLAPLAFQSCAIGSPDAAEIGSETRSCFHASEPVAVHSVDS
jgi:hypothetical protein